MRQLLSLWICLTLLWPGLAVAAAGSDIVILHDASSRTHVGFVKALVDVLADSGLTTRLADSRDWQQQTPQLPQATALLVTVGSEAAQLAARHHAVLGNPRVLATLIPETRYRQLQAVLSPPQHWSTLLLDQPVSRQLNLIRAALPAARTVAMVYSAETAHLVARVQTGLPAGWVLNAVRYEPGENPLPAFNTAMREADVLLTVADSKVFKPGNIKGILLSTYRRRLPVIGFSRSYVKAGALTAAYSTPAQLAQQAAEIIRARLAAANDQPPRSLYPKYFSIAVNARVARSLGIHSLDSEQLQQRVLSMQTDREP